MTATSEHRVCRCCGKYKADIDGLCWGCHAEVELLQREFNSADTVTTDEDACVDCGEDKIHDEETGLCYRCHKLERRKLAAEVEERRQEFLAEQHEAHLEDIGYGKVQQARAERELK